MNIDSCLTFFFCIFLTIIYQEAGTLYVDETTCNICMAESQHAKDTTAMGPGISDLQGQKKRFLGGGFKYILYFHPTYWNNPIWRKIQFDKHVFQLRLKPPTSYHLC